MLIVDQKKEGVLNFGPGTGIDIRIGDKGFSELVAYGLFDKNDGIEFYCGLYASFSTAKAALNEIITAVQEGQRVFYMPPDKEAT